MSVNFKQWLGILTTVGPLVLLAIPGGAAVLPFVPLIIKSIADAQQQPGATGATKKAFVLALVEDGAKTAALVNPHLIDPTLTVQAAGLGIDAVITTVNAIQTAHATAPPAVVALPPVVAPPAP